MKCFFVILLVATTVVISTKIGDNAVDNNEEAIKAAPAPATANSLQGLFQTLIKLVEGVLDSDKFVLSTLGIVEPLDLTDKQIRDLKRLLESLGRINSDLAKESD